MHFQLATITSLFLVSGALCAPLPGNPVDPPYQGTNSLESTPGPYKFEPAPVWRREAGTKQPPAGSGSLESTPGPYKFEPAPVWRREAGTEQPAPGSLESTPGPYKFEPAPVWRREV